MAQRRHRIEVHRSAITSVAIENHISAAAISQRFHAIRPIVAQIINDRVGPELLGKLKLVLAPHQADHLCAGRLGDLHDQRAHSPRRRVHDHPLIGLHLGGAVNQQPTGIGTGGKTGREGPIKIIGDTHQRVRRGDGEVGVAAPLAVGRHTLVNQ